MPMVLLPTQVLIIGRRPWSRDRRVQEFWTRIRSGPEQTIFFGPGPRPDPMYKGSADPGPDPFVLSPNF